MIDILDDAAAIGGEERNVPGGAKSSGSEPSDADRHVGNKIRQRRATLGMSQQQLADMIGVTYQQTHKYEHGLNRISAGRLYIIAEALDAPLSWFFEGMDGSVEKAPRHRLSLELAQNFAVIEDERHREALSEMASALAQQSLAARK